MTAPSASFAGQLARGVRHLCGDGALCRARYGRHPSAGARRQPARQPARAPRPARPTPAPGVTAVSWRLERKRSRRDLHHSSWFSSSGVSCVHGGAERIFCRTYTAATLTCRSCTPFPTHRTYRSRLRKQRAILTRLTEDHTKFIHHVRFGRKSNVRSKQALRSGYVALKCVYTYS